jgi:hypothetical protein
VGPRMTLKDTGCKPQAHGQSEPGGGPCLRCGRPRCCATAKSRDGERCRKNPHPGATICSNHGLTQAGRAAAEVRQQEAAADAEIRKLWPGLAAASPVKDPVGQMEQLAGALTHMLDVVGSKVNDLDHLAGGKGLTQLRGELVLLDKVAGHLRQLLEAMARLGIAERQIQLDQQLAELVVGAFRAALAAVSLLPADRARLLEVYLDRLGLENVVAGEVVA